jgi:hypothetical protein
VEAEAFPQQTFWIVDAIVTGNSQMNTVLRKQVEQAVYENLKAVIAGELVSAECMILGFSDGHVHFVNPNPLCERSFPAEVSAT